MAIANIKRAAELTALAEEVRINALRDGYIDPLLIVRLDGAARRVGGRRPAHSRKGR